MAARRADATPARPRPRPRAEAAPAAAPSNGTAPARQPAVASANGHGRALARHEPAPNTQLVAAAGSAIVTTARVGRLLGRSGWRIAKQLPGVKAVEQQAQKLRQAAAMEMIRLLEVPQQFFGGTDEEQRAMMMVANAGNDPAPLRTAMSELLHRSTDTTGRRSREYLFGTIVSQLVPDEARILAKLAESGPFPALDVLAKQTGRAGTRTVLANASTVGAAAGIALPANTATYLTRLQGFGLLEFGGPAEDADVHYDQLLEDPAVQDARAQVDGGKLGGARMLRKTVTLSALGREFWAACAPDRPGLR